MDGAEFLISLKESMSGPATAAQSALARLEAQIRSEKEALAGLEGKLASSADKMAEMQSGLSAAKGKLADIKSGKSPFDPKAYKSANDELVKLSNGIGKAKGTHDNLVKAVTTKKGNVGVLEGALPQFKQLAEESGKSKVGLEELSSAAKQSGGGIGQLAGGFEELMAAGPAGVIVLVVVALVALAAAAIAAGIAVAHFAALSADAARSARLLSNAAAGSTAGGAELEAVINDIAGKAPLARDRIAEMGRALEVAHLSGRRMQNALESMATVASVIGDGAASKLQGIAEQAQRIRRFLVTKADLEGTGLAFDELASAVAESAHTTVANAKAMLQQGRVSVDQGLEAMAAAIKKKFGATLQAQMLSLSTQMAKLKENVGLLFSGVNIEAFLSGLKTVTDLFSQNTFTGVALKKVLTEALNAFFNAASKVFPYVKAFMQGIIIAALIVYLYFKKIAIAISNAFGGDSKSKIDWIKVAMYAGIAAVGTLVGIMVALAVIFAVVAVAALGLMLPILLPFILPLVAIGILVYAIYKVYEAFQALRALDLTSIGKNIVNGLINGIKSMASAAAQAVGDLASSIKSTITSALGIASPSKVFAKYGNYTAQGFAKGVTEESGKATAAVGGLGSGQPGSGGAGKGGKLRTGGPVSIVINVLAAMTDAEIEKVRGALSDLFEQDDEGGPEHA